MSRAAGELCTRCRLHLRQCSVFRNRFQRLGWPQSTEGKVPDKVDLLAALRAQQFQLERLLHSQLWVSNAPRASLDEVTAQIARTKRILAELETAVEIRKEEAFG